MTAPVPVSANGTTFYVEVVDTGGVGVVDLDQVFSLDGVADTVKAVAGSLSAVWQAVKPAEATVEFGLKLTAKSGRLTGLIVDGGGEASLTVKLTWRPDGGTAG